MTWHRHCYGWRVCLPAGSPPGPTGGSVFSSVAEGALCAKQVDARGQTVVGQVPDDKKTGSAQITTSKVCRGGVSEGARHLGPWRRQMFYGRSVKLKHTQWGQNFKTWTKCRANVDIY